jgi:hypothetical protein
VDAPCRAWARRHVDATGDAELVSDEAWARVWRLPTADGVVWCKECAPVQAFEPHLTAALSDRWPDRVARVLAHDTERRWLLLADAGTQLRALGDPLDVWLRALPQYAEMQRGETRHVAEHLAAGVPDLRPRTLPEKYDDLLHRDLPIDDHEVARLHYFARHFAQLCDELDGAGIPASVQHDDPHGTNVFVDHDHHRVIDWGDASIGHPFTSLVVTFRFLEPHASPTSLERLRDAYLEPWGRTSPEVFGLATRVGAVARAIAYIPQREAVPAAMRPEFDEDFTVVLRRALRQLDA